MTALVAVTGVKMGKVLSAGFALAGKFDRRDEMVRQGFLPIFVDDASDSRVLVEGAVEAGCKVVECSCRRRDTRPLISWIKREFPHITVLGATLIDGVRASAFLERTRPHFISVDEMVDLGVDGLVSFLAFRPESYVKYGKRLIMIPGVSSYNEALEQLEMGADMIKLQGNTAWDASHLRTAVTLTHGLFPILVTNGISPQTIPGLIAAGAAMIGTGFNIILKEQVDAGTPLTSQIVADAINMMKSVVAQARGIHQSDFYRAVESRTENPLASGRWFTSGNVET
jgi:2-keto-3-deoxy-6-phosphogluconate aldolase